MDNEIKKFLEFNENKVYFISAQGVWYIAIKPICEALGVDYRAQHKSILKDEILGPASSVQTMQVPGDQGRGWACLPEFFIYGWIFSIQSESEELQQYKWKCYELLYNHFHGSIIERPAMLKVKSQTQKEIERLEEELQKNETYIKLQQLRGKYSEVKKELRKQDMFIQLSFWETENAN